MFSGLRDLKGNFRDVKDIASHGQTLDAKRSVPIHLAVAGPEGTALRRIAALLSPLTQTTYVETIVMGADPVEFEPGVELVVLVVETVAAGLAETIEVMRRRGLPFVSVRPGVHSGLSRPSDEAMRLLGAGEVLDVDPGDETAEDALFGALTHYLEEKKIALCASFPGARRHVAKDVIGNTSWQNGLLAGIIIVPGADMPILTANQIKMVLELAAIYGKPMTWARAKELIAVVGAGFTFRTIARELLDFIPGPGWPLKAGVAYVGTMAMGKAAQQYMIHGDEWADAARQKIRQIEAPDR